MDSELWIVGENVPDVRECYGHPKTGATTKCDQCDGGHAHVFVTCAVVPAFVGDRRRPVRCHVCGARKCDVPDCIERRHHRSPHLSRDRVLYPVGG